MVFFLMFITISMGCVEEKQKNDGKMKIFSSAFSNGASIPIEYTCDGDDVSPPLSFVGIPNATKTLALIMDDPDAPGGSWVHWLVWNIPSNVTGFSKNENITFPQGKNDFGMIRYGGPCPPSGLHHYYFKLYALDTILDLPEGATREQLEAAMMGHIIETAQLIGVYER